MEPRNYLILESFDSSSGSQISFGTLQIFTVLNRVITALIQTNEKIVSS